MRTTEVLQKITRTIGTCVTADQVYIAEKYCILLVNSVTKGDNNKQKWLFDFMREKGDKQYERIKH